jgi:ADP-dependent NAD(P)H-hydrate dehydratase
MSSRPERVTAELLREWGLPDPGDSKNSRGQAIVVGGSRRSPGAVLVAAEAALRVGAGKAAMIVPAAIEPGLGIAIPEAAVLALPGQGADSDWQSVREEVVSADAVLFGPGFDDPEQTRATLLAVADPGIRCLILDAFALGVLPQVSRSSLPQTLILNPNHDEAAILLGREVGGEPAPDLIEIARRFDAVVNCYGLVVAPDGSAWEVVSGGPGLGTSGSGDVLAGAITGFAARGVEPSHAAVWGSWCHARAGDRLTERAGIGFLARDLAGELTPALSDALRGDGEGA